MPKMKKRMPYLSRNEGISGPPKTFLYRKRKRKVGVTLIKALKNKQQPADLFLDEPAIRSTPKQKRNTVMHTVHENSNEGRSCSDVKGLPSNTYQTADYCSSDVVADLQNDETESFAETTISLCVLPIIIDDSSDADCSSAADTTNVYNTSAISEACSSEDVTAEDGDSGITCGLG